MSINKEMFKEIIGKKEGKVIFKFTASWCGPCKKAAPFIDEYINSLPENVKYYEIDVDKSLDVYGMLKTKRMVSGVPSLLCYYEDNTSVWPDEAISSSRGVDIKYFFETVLSN
jgi:thioredoxin 1